MESIFNPDHSLKQAGFHIIHYWEIHKAFTAQCLKSQVNRAAVSKTQQTSISVVIKNQEVCLSNSWGCVYSVLHPKAAKYRFEVGQGGG